MQPISRMTLEKMNEERKEDFVLVNVLPRESFRKAHIRTSINIPHEDESFVEDVTKVAGGKDRTIVVYCASKDCDASPKAARKLDEAGFERVLDYEGGTRDWQQNH